MSIITIRGSKKAPRSWELIWKTIRTHERVYMSVANQAAGEQIPIIRKFLQIWDPIYTDAMEIQARGGNVPEERIRRLVRALFVAREAAMRIGLGLSADGVFYPKIDDATMRAIRAYRSSPPPLAVAGDTMSPIPENFRACCQACITEDEILVLSCNVGERTFSASIDLRPIIERVQEMIRRYHANVLHGDMQEETISGLGDWYRRSVRAAARIANAKAAKKLWNKVQAHYGEIEKGLYALGPYGQAAAIGLRTGKTVQRMLTKAKQGNARAVADVRAVVHLAKQGDPSAKQVTDIMRTLNEMGKIKDEKIENAVGGWFFNRPYRVAAVSPDMVLRGFYNLGAAL